MRHASLKTEVETNTRAHGNPVTSIPSKSRGAEQGSHGACGLRGPASPLLVSRPGLVGQTHGSHGEYASKALQPPCWWPTWPRSPESHAGHEGAEVLCPGLGRLPPAVPQSSSALRSSFCCTSSDLKSLPPCFSPLGHQHARWQGPGRLRHACPNCWHIQVCLAALPSAGQATYCTDADSASSHRPRSQRPAPLQGKTRLADPRPPATLLEASSTAARQTARAKKARYSCIHPHTCS